MEGASAVVKNSQLTITRKTPRNFMDSPESWWMAIASVLAFFVCMGFTRADGVMLVALMQEKGVNRETASWPFNLAGAAVIFMAPITGILSSRFSPFILGICGSLLFAAGYTACYFSTNIYYLALCLGVLKGSGQGMVITVIPALINNCFQKYRATAMGIATTGTPAGGFVLPLLVQYLLGEYSLRGTFLILGGISLHAVLGCTVYIFYPKSSRTAIHEHQALIDNHNAAATNERTPLLHNQKDVSKTAMLCKEVISKPSKSFLPLIRNVFLTRGFYFVAINQIISLQLVEMFSLVVVDYSVDKGASYTSAVLLITITSGCEIFGRLGFGWITDRRFLSRPFFMMLCQILSAALVLSFSFTTSYYSLSVIAGLLGMIQGSTLSVTHIIFSDYLKKEEIALAVAFARSFHGLASVARSPIIGFFRDELGSYDLLFISASSIFFAASLMWLFEVLYLHFQSMRRKHTSFQQNSSYQKTLL